MKAERNRLLARIHIARKELGMKCSEYRAVLGRFGVVSAAELDAGQLADLDKCFRGLGWKPKRACGQWSVVSGQKYPEYLAKWKRLGHRAGMATAEQLAKIESDWDRLEGYWNKGGKGHREAALRGFLVARFGCEDLRFLSFGRAGKVIEAIKAITALRGG